MNWFQQMSPFEKRLAVLAVVVFVALVTVRAMAPRPVDWTPNYEADDTRPFGSKVLFETMDAAFPASAIETVNVSPYLHLRDTSLTNTAYVFVTSEYNPDPEETRRLLTYASRGNTVWIAADEITGPLKDTLGIDIHVPFNVRSEFAIARADTVAFDTLYMPGLTQNQELPVRTNTVDGFIRGIRDERARVVSMKPDDTVQASATKTATAGGTEWERRGPVDPEAARPVMVRVPRGDGQIYVAAMPKLFTNVNVVREPSRRSVFAHLSVIPPTTKTVFWDARNKPLVAEARTPLRFLLTDRMLRTALYIGVTCLVLLLLVNTRRRQRPIPVMEPPSNDTLNFVRTVGDLYHRQGENLKVARRKIQYLSSYIRIRLDLPVSLGVEAHDEENHGKGDGETPDRRWDPERLGEQLSRRSGVPRDDVDALLDAVTLVRTNATLTDDELRQVSDALHTFYTQSDR